MRIAQVFEQVFGGLRLAGAGLSGHDDRLGQFVYPHIAYGFIRYRLVGESVTIFYNIPISILVTNSKDMRRQFTQGTTIVLLDGIGCVELLYLTIRIHGD